MFPSNSNPNHPMNRRAFLNRAWNGVGALGLAGLLGDDVLASNDSLNPLAALQPHLPRKAKHCIFLFMQGGVSQMDSFEYRPRLRELHGKPIPEPPNISGANGYLPAAHQGTLLRPTGVPILNLDRPQEISASQQRSEFNLLNKLNRKHRDTRSNQSSLEARIASYELAFRMQTAAPEIVDIFNEPESVRKLYGLDDSKTEGFGRQCLLARRLVERGVRYSLLIHGVQIGKHSWDDHGDVGGGMIRHCTEVDRPVAGLLEDLKRTGLLEETLVVWASEMGRTPFRNATTVGKTPGREHNSYGLCMWMAGGNVKPGATAGKTDEYSLRSVGSPIHIRDVHATILNLMGLEDERLTFTHAGRIRKLTDIGGEILDGLIA